MVATGLIQPSEKFLNHCLLTKPEYVAATSFVWRMKKKKGGKKRDGKTRTPQTSFTFLIESLIRDKKNNGGFRQLECLEGLMR